MGAEKKDHYVEKVVDYIMRKCLWQFHSRAWDRERQNEGIMTQTTQILCGEQPDVQTAENRCYWVDAVMMARGLTVENPELADMNRDDIRLFMADAKKRLDFLTIHGSLNQELTDPKY